MVYYIKAIDVDSLFVESKSNNKKHFNNENLGSHIVSYDDFLTEVFFHNEYNMIGNVIYDKGILEIDYIDFSNDNYKKYTNTFKLDGSNEEFDCMMRYIEFINEIRDIVDYYNKTKNERLSIINAKKEEIDKHKNLKNKVIDYIYSYAMDEEMKLLSSEETGEILDYIRNNRDEVINAVMKDTRGYTIDKIESIFRLGLVGSVFSGLYALNNPNIGTAIMAGGAAISIGGLAATYATKYDQISAKIKEMMYLLKSIYDMEDCKGIMIDRVLSEIDIVLEYINKHEDYDLDDIIERLDILKNKYIEELKNKFQFGDLVDEKDYCYELAQIEMDMYDITCVDNIDVDDMHIRMAYEVINDIINNPYPGCKEDLLLVKRFALDYLKADLSFVGFDYQHLFIDRLLDLKICIKDKRYAIEDGRRINKFII